MHQPPSRREPVSCSRWELAGSRAMRLLDALVWSGVWLAAAAAALVAACSRGMGVEPALLGLFHRRLKRWTPAKPVYLSCAWTAVAVALPAAHDPAARHAAWAAGVVAPTILANVALSNLRDGEGFAGRFGRARTLRAAA